MSSSISRPGKPSTDLFSPCKCDGSLKYIHFDCLMDWIKHKTGGSGLDSAGEDDEGKLRCEFECEICKSSIQFKFFLSFINVPLNLIVL